MYLPNYGVFDEARYFQSGAEPATFELNGVQIGVAICEDIWEPGPPARTEALAGAHVIACLSASPYRKDYGRGRERMLTTRAIDYLSAVVFVNAVGGQDELVFDGHSLAADADGGCWPVAPSSRRSWPSARSSRVRSPPHGCATRATAPTSSAAAAPRAPRPRSRTSSGSAGSR